MRNIFRHIDDEDIHAWRRYRLHTNRRAVYGRYRAAIARLQDCIIRPERGGGLFNCCWKFLLRRRMHGVHILLKFNRISFNLSGRIRFDSRYGWVWNNCLALATKRRNARCVFYFKPWIDRIRLGIGRTPRRRINKVSAAVVDAELSLSPDRHLRAQIDLCARAVWVKESMLFCNIVDNFIYSLRRRVEKLVHITAFGILAWIQSFFL